MRRLLCCWLWMSLSAALAIPGSIASRQEPTQDPTAQNPEKPEGEKKAGVWLDVPYIKQTEEGCGSASLAMLLQYWSAHGADVPPDRADADAIQKQLYNEKAHGIY